MAMPGSPFHSILAIFLSNFALGNRTDVRKRQSGHLYRSTSYAWTNQAVGLQHWLPEGANCPSAEPEALPDLPFNLFKQFLSGKPSTGILLRTKQLKIYAVATCDIGWTTDVIVVVRTVLVDRVVHVPCQIRSDQLREIHPGPASEKVTMIVFLDELEHGIRAPPSLQQGLANTWCQQFGPCVLR